MTDHQQQHDEYICKAIIALNNAGVHLIKHGLYCEAIETLKDSMRFMEKSFFRRSDYTPENILDLSITRNTTVLDRSAYEAALQAAWGRKSLLNCHRHHSPRNLEVPTDSSPISINIIVVSDQDHPLKVYAALLSQCWSTTSFCCVTIDLVPNYDALGSNYDQLQRESALILYNLSIAYRCVAVTHRPITIYSTDPTTGNIIALTTSATMCLENYTMSFQLAEFSHIITYTMLQELSVQGVALVHVSLNLLVSSLLALHNLRQMSYETEDLFDIRLHYTSAFDIMIMAISTRYRLMMEEGENQMLIRAPAA